MKAIAVDAFQQYTEWAGKCRSNQVYPSSITEGFQTGNIFTEDAASFDAVLFWHYCGFAYLSGNAGSDFLQEIYETFFLADTARRFVLITEDNDVIRFFDHKQDLRTGRRLEYKYAEKGLLPDSAESPFRIERINDQLLARIEGRIIPSFSWENGQDFLKNGFGFVVLEQEEIAAVAFSAAVSSEEIDIGVETKEPFRGKGYARTLTDRMCREILSRGKKPVWAHSEENEASMRTALACGFIKCRTNTIIRKI